MEKQLKYSFVVACYNSQNTITHVIEEIATTVKSNESYEIICVNDSSPDDVLNVLKSLQIEYDNLKIIDLARNFGQHAALMAGFHEAQGEIIVALDDDGQSPVDEVYKLFYQIEQGADVVISTTKEKKHNRLKLIGSKVNEIMSSILIGTPRQMNFVPLYAFKRFVCNEILNYKGAYPYIIGLLFRTTKNIRYVDVQHRAREIGKSNYTFKKLISLWFNGFTAFSVKPLRVATLIGMITAFCGFFYGGFIIIQKLVRGNEIVSGWSSLMAVILFIGGMLMVFLGLLGEYLGRIYLNNNCAPQYVIRDKISFYD